LIKAKHHVTPRLNPTDVAALIDTFSAQRYQIRLGEENDESGEDEIDESESDYEY